MTLFLSKGFRARPAASTVLLALGLALAGCAPRYPPGTYGTPPNDAYALSGGKSTETGILFQRMKFND